MLSIVGIGAGEPIARNRADATIARNDRASIVRR
jgi:hypothetical protein